MGFPPELHAPHVHRAAEVIPPLDRSPPPALAGGLAGRTADSFRTILLMPPIPRVSAIQPLAVMAPAPSLMGHGKLQIQSPMMPQDTPIPEENATPRKPTPQIRRRRKKTIAQITEEDPAEENPIFKPAGLPHFRIGHDKWSMHGIRVGSERIRPQFSVRFSSAGRIPAGLRSGCRRLAA